MGIIYFMDGASLSSAIFTTFPVWRLVHVAVTMASLVTRSFALYMMFELVPVKTPGWHINMSYMWLYLWSDEALNVAQFVLWIAVVVLVVKAIRGKKWSLK